MQKKKIIAIILAAGMLATGCGNGTTPNGNSADTEIAEVNSNVDTGDTSEAGVNTEETDDAEENTESEEDTETIANELFRTAINSADYLTDGTYRLMVFAGASPVSSASENGKDAKGTDYVYLCRYKADESEEVYCLLTISAYEDGSIRAVISWPSDIDTGFSAEEGITGAWGMNYGADEETKNELKKALQTDYAEYTLISPIATQVVAGTNYRVLCEKDDAENGTEYAIATIYLDLSGNAEVTEFANIG